ncbi:hypothetical protein JXJ21_04930, partial [candidate division KSB1 bacterium]|nr:hypothetical protein [candidate division KSB1 bacterium]
LLSFSSNFLLIALPVIFKYKGYFDRVAFYFTTYPAKKQVYKLTNIEISGAQVGRFMVPG